MKTDITIAEIAATLGIAGSPILPGFSMSAAFLSAAAVKTTERAP